MKPLKTTLFTLFLLISFGSCKQAIDKEKNNLNQTETQTEKTALFLKNVDASTFKSLVDKQSGIILDVRTPEEFQAGHIPGAINIDWKNQDEFKTKIKALAKDKTLLVYCHSGHRSGLATKYLKAQGYEKIYNLETGILGWKAANYDVEK